MPYDNAPWSAESEFRLIEMYRCEHSHEEIARELGVPLDAVERRLAELFADPEDPSALYRRD